MSDLKTEILVITGRSGSLSSIADEVIGGYNTTSATTTLMRSGAAVQSLVQPV